MLETVEVKPMGWKLIKFPEPGEYVVLHCWLKNVVQNGREKTEFVRAVAMGTHPWGKRGARTGKCIPGGGTIIAMTAEPNDDAFDLFLSEMLTYAIQTNPSDSDVVSVAGEMALELKDRGIEPNKIFKCPKCRKDYETLERNFCRKTGVLWYREDGKRGEGDVRKFATSICISCLRSYKEELEKSRERAVEAFCSTKSELAKSIATSLSHSNYINIENLIDPVAYDRAFEAVDSLIAEIR